MHNYIILLTLSLSISSSFATHPIKLNEDLLLQIARKGAPRLDEIEAAFLSTKVHEGEKLEDFAPEVFGSANYSETNERALVQFQPIFGPIAQAQLGVRQKLRHGISTSAEVTTDQRSSSSSPSAGKFNDVTTTTLRLGLEFDLWKDIFGRLSKARLETAMLETKRAEIEKEIQTKTFLISLRRVYWSLVANHEALKISGELLKTAERQVQETAKRLKNAVAEADEMARYQAQLSSRQGTILFLQYQRETYLKQLRNLVPELGRAEISLDGYDLDKTMLEVVACTATIASESKVPYHFTKYDEAVSLMRNIKTSQAQVHSRYSDMDLKLVTALKATGVDADAQGTNAFRGSYGGSIDDIGATNRTGYEAGLFFTLPLGDSKKHTQRTKELYDEKRLMASISATDAQVVNTHMQLVKSVVLLKDVIAAQRNSSDQLAKRLVLVRKKYEQARVSVNDLIMDQDAFLSSELRALDTELEILNTIFDYLIIFSETPCSFNRT